MLTWSAAKLFDEDAIDTIVKLVSAARAELDALSPVPFLHDTTTKNVIVTPRRIILGYRRRRRSVLR